MSMKIFEWRDYDSREYLVNSFILESSYSYPLHSHQNHWELVYCQEGSFTHLINSKTYSQREGDLIFIREADAHLLKGRNFKYSNIAFSGAWIKMLKDIAGSETVDALTGAHRDPPLLSIPTRERVDFENRIKGILGKERNGRSELTFSHFLLYVFDTYLLDAEHAELQTDFPLWFQDLLLSADRPEEPVPSLETLVDRSCRCGEHLSRTFKKYLGVTPSQYLKDLKLKRAAGLLRSTNYPVKEIAWLCGYNNANYFHKQFRQFCGQTPADFRKSRGRRIH